MKQMKKQNKQTTNKQTNKQTKQTKQKQTNKLAQRGKKKEMSQSNAESITTTSIPQLSPVCEGRRMRSSKEEETETEGTDKQTEERTNKQKGGKA